MISRKRLLKFFTVALLVPIVISLFLPARPVSGQSHNPSKKVKAYAGSIAGNETCNPCVANVIDAVEQLNAERKLYVFSWGDRYPPVLGAGSKSHWQGIQRLPSYLSKTSFFVLTSSHRYRAFSLDFKVQNVSFPACFALVNLTGLDAKYVGEEYRLTPANHGRIIKTQQISPEFDHSGGIQMIGKYLLVGADGHISDRHKTANLSLWDLSDPLHPRNVWGDDGWEVNGSNANSAGVVRLAAGEYLMLRALASAKILEFYVLDPDLKRNPAQYLKQPSTIWQYQELLSELWEQNGQVDMRWAAVDRLLVQAGFQVTNLVRECGTGEIYLIAAYGPKTPRFGGTNTVEAFRLDLFYSSQDSKQHYEVLITKVAKTRLRMGGAIPKSISLQAAAGIYVDADNRLHLYVTEHGTSVDGFVRFAEFNGPVQQSLDAGVSGLTMMPSKP